MIEGVGRMMPVTPAVGEAQLSAQAAAAQAAGVRAGKDPAPASVADVSLGRLAAAMAAAPPVDAAKVATLRAAIAEGVYRPDPMAIAGAMMAQAEPGV